MLSGEIAFRNNHYYFDKAKAPVTIIYHLVVDGVIGNRCIECPFNAYAKLFCVSTTAIKKLYLIFYLLI